MRGPLRYARSRACWQIGAELLRAFFSTEMRAWYGKEPLWKVFWVYGVLASVGLGLLYLLAMEEGRIAVQQAILIGIAAYTAWVLVAIWRCAENSPWESLARGLTVAWAANTVLVLAFLQADLFVAYVGR